MRLLPRLIRSRFRSHSEDTAESSGASPTSSAGAPTWTIDFRANGDFAATSPPGEGTAPSRFRGTAPTAEAAARLLRWYFLDTPVAVAFDSPCRNNRWHWPDAANPSAAPLKSAEFGALLHESSPAYQACLTAARDARDRLRKQTDLHGYLAGQAANLNVSDPQLPDVDLLRPFGLPRDDDHASADTAQWVPTPLIVATNSPVWGDFGGHRNDTPALIARALRDTGDLHQFFHRMFAGDPVHLMRAPGWAGPLYGIGNGGNHRVHTARMLDLPWLPAVVTITSKPTSWTVRSLSFGDQDASDYRRFREHVQDRARLLDGLIRRGIITGHLTQDKSDFVLHCTHLPAPWLLRRPELAAAANVMYESRYPGALAQLGIPASVGTDPAAWSRWLLSA